MKRTIISCLFLVLCVSLVQAQTAKDNAVSTGKVKEEISKILQEMADAWPRKDQKVFERYLASSYLILNPSNEIETRAAVVQSVGQGLELPEGMKIKISVEGLEVTTEGNSAVAIYRHVFEMDSPQFQMKSPQRVSTFFVRNGNTWLVLAEHRTYLPNIRPTKKMDPKALDAITGEYQAEGGKTAVVTREGDKIYSQKTDFPKLELTPDSESTFYAKQGNQVTSFTFIRDNEGKVLYMVVHNPLPDSTVFVRKKIK